MYCPYRACNFPHPRAKALGFGKVTLRNFSHTRAEALGFGKVTWRNLPKYLDRSMYLELVHSS